VFKIPQEARQRGPIPIDRSGEEWIHEGRIEFINYSNRYRPKTQIILKNINLSISSGEKVGIVGRTGAGKSTVCLSLCRILEAESGRIEIDGIDISTVGLSDLRERITIIPQDPSLFEDTLRFNLDPEGKYSDSEIMEIINKAALTELVVSNENGLGRPISMKGDNLSTGEKQLICICRAILSVSNISMIF
jgi:ATP-binding cassette subfamily C (CFTR/MRP) protein 1